MSNQLRVAKIHSILTLHERGWSCRRIAIELGIHRETVGRYIRQARGPDSKPATAPTGWLERDHGPKPASAPTGSQVHGDASVAGEAPPGSPVPGGPVERGNAADGAPSLPRSVSDCGRHHVAILAGLDQGLSAARMHQDLVRDHGPHAPSYYSVRRYVRRLRCASPVPMRRMECAAGHEAQVDFGSGAPVRQAAGGKRRTHVLRIVLSHSRKAYSEAVYRQTTDEFLRCLENAFWHFGGVPATLVLDNLRAAVSRADWFDPEINPKVQSFCAHYGIVPLPTKPRTPRHKGKVERGIAYVKGNGLQGRVFDSLEEQNRHLLEWECSVADTRIHGTTKRQVQQMFQQAEKPALRPLPAEGRFPCFQEGQRVVNRDGHVEVAKAYYSAPPEYLGRRVWVRWDAHVVRLFDARMRPIAIHARHEEGRFSTQSRHIVAQKINSIERGTGYLLRRAERIGTGAGRWARAMLQSRGISGVRVLQGLISLADRHPGSQIERACEVALSHQAFRLRTIRNLLQRRADHQQVQQPLDERFIDEHPIIRSLADYSQLVHDVFQHPHEGTPA